MLKKQYNKTKGTCKVTFSIPNHILENSEVRVLGEFNNWEWENGVAMESKKDLLVGQVVLPTGRDYQFRYRTSNGIWENDSHADNYTPSPYGVDNSVVVVDKVVVDKKNAKKASKKSAKDDLKKIEGVGPKIASLLNDAGIFTFVELSNAPIAKLQDVLTAAGPRFKMHKPTTWAEQATLASAGKWDELKKLQDVLDGGKRK